jgi:hypothetical protein
MEKKDKNWEKWLAIANFIAIIFIGVFFALYMRIREEQFQTKMLEMQTEIDSKTGYGAIEYYCYDDRGWNVVQRCLSQIEFRNTGFATAKNIKILIGIDYVYECKWQLVIQSIEGLGITVFPPVEAKTSFAQYDLPSKSPGPVFTPEPGCEHEVVNANNTAIVEIPSLSPQQSITINLKYLKSATLNSLEANIPTKLSILSGKVSEELSKSNPIYDILDGFFSSPIVSLYVSVICENCQNKEYYAITLDSIKSISYDTTNYQETGQKSEWEGTVKVYYVSPPGTTITDIRSETGNILLPSGLNLILESKPMGDYYYTYSINP